MNIDRETALFNALYSLSMKLREAYHLTELLQEIVEQATHLLKGTGGGFYLCDSDHQEAQCVVSFQTRADYRGTVLKYGEGVAGFVAQTGQGLIIDNYRKWHGRALKYEAEQPFQSVVSAPVIWQGQVTGVLHVLDDRTEKRFSKDDLDLLSLFANQSALVIENTRLLESEQKRYKEAETLRQAAALLTSSLNLNELLDNILTLLNQVVSYDSATVFLSEKDHLRAKAARNLPKPESVLGKTFPMDDALFQEIIHIRQTLILDDAQQDPRYHNWGETHNTRSWMGIPMILKDAVIGILTCDRQEVGVYSAKDAAIAQAFSDQVSIAIENARLFEAERAQLTLARTLQEVGALLTSQPPQEEVLLEQILQNLLELLKKVIYYDSASIHLINPAGKLYLAAERGFPNTVNARRVIDEIGDYLLESRWKTDHAIVIPDTYQSNQWKVTPESTHVRSWIGAPLLVKGVLIGSLNVDSQYPNTFSEDDGQTVMMFANQAAIAIENARLFEAERKRVVELEAARQASISVTASLELPQVLYTILESALKMLKHSGAQGFNAHIFLYDSETEQLTFGAALYTDGTRGEPFSTPRPQGLTATVAHSGKPILVEDMRTHPLFHDTPASWSGAIVGLPLIIGQRVIGVMNVAFSEPRHIPETELHALQLLGDQAAIAIENARLYQQAATERRHLGLIFDISRELTRSLDSEKILDRAITLTCQALESQVGEAFLYLPDENRLRLCALYGREYKNLSYIDQQLNLRPGKGLAGWVAQTRQATNVPNVHTNKYWIHLPGVDDDIEAALCTPVEAEGKLLGILTVLAQQTNAFTTEHVHLMQAICQEVALALSNAQRYQQVQRQLAELTLIQNLTLAFNQRLEVRVLLDEVVTQLAEKLGYTHIAIFLIEADYLVLKASRGLQITSRAFPLSSNLAQRILHHGMIHYAPDISVEEDYAPWTDSPIVAEIAVPIYQKGDLAGVILIGSLEKERLTSQDRDVLQVLAGQAAVALENAILYETVQNHAAKLETTVAQRTAALTGLYQLSQEIGYILSFDELIRLLLRHLHHAIDCDVVAGCLELQNNHIAKIQLRRPIGDLALENIRQTCLNIAPQKESQLPPAGDLPYELLYDQEYDPAMTRLERINSWIWASITLDHRTVGRLALGSVVPDAFGTAQERLLSTFANHASTAIQRLTILLTAQQKQLESLVENLSIGVLLLDHDFRLLLANPAGREILPSLGIETGERQATSLRLNRLGDASLEELVARPSAPIPIEIHAVDDSKRIFNLQLGPAGHPLAQEGNQWVLALTDITKERESLQRAQIQERLATVGQLAAGIAHDFNNIMAAILVYTDLLLYDPSISPASQDKLSIIQRQIQRASSLIRQILDFSRRSVMDQSDLDLLPLIKELDKMLARILPETIQLQFNYQPGDYWVNGDPARLQQALMNLAVNARDAMPNGGILRFSLSKLTLNPGTPPPIPEMPPGAWVCIKVNDTGVGISPDDRNHIFEPFFTTKPVSQGTGLGLAQVYGIVRQHEGFIDVESQVGQGATFSIYLPLVEIGYQAEKASEKPSLAGQGQMILIVEDDNATRQALETLLQAVGYRTLVATNGIEALQLLEQSPRTIDLIISDIVMPHMGGIELYQSLKERSPNTKLLLITGHPIDELSQKMLEKGQINWLQKPFTVQGLNQAIQNLLHSK